MKFLYVPGYRYPANLNEPILCGDLRYSFNLSRALVRKGHNVCVISRKNPTDQTEDILDGVRIVRYQSEFEKLFKTSFDISFRRYKMFKNLSNKADVLICNSPLSLELILSLQKPFIYICSGLEDIKNYSLTLKEMASQLGIVLLRDPCKKMSWKKAIFVNTTAKKEDQTLLSWGVPHSKVCTIGPGVELNRYCPKSDTLIKKLKSKLDLLESDNIILSISRFSPAKGLLETLEAFSQLLKTKNNTKLLLVGVLQSHRSDYFQLIKDKINNLQLNEKVIIQFNVPEHTLPFYYNMADIFTVFSVGYDPLPTTIIEAMACGTPVISSYFPTREQMIEHGQTAFFVKERDLDGWVRNTLTILDNPALSSKMQSNGLKKVALDFDMDCVAEKYIKLIEGEFS